MINVNMLKPGITFKENNDLFVVISSQHSQQGRGQATVKVKVKNLRTRTTLLKAFIGGDKVEPARIEKRAMNVLYADGTNIILMDDETFDQIEIPIVKIKWEMNFLTEGVKVQVRKFKKEILDIELPSSMAMQVIAAPKAIKGNTQNNPQKKIKLATGFELEVPMFIKEGDTIMIATNDGKYIKRGNK